MSKNGQDRGAQRLRMARQTPRRLEISDAWHGYTRLQQAVCCSNRARGELVEPGRRPGCSGGSGRTTCGAAARSRWRSGFGLKSHRIRLSAIRKRRFRSPKWRLRRSTRATNVPSAEPSSQTASKSTRMAPLDTSETAAGVCPKPNQAFILQYEFIKLHVDLDKKTPGAMMSYL